MTSGGATPGLFDSARTLVANFVALAHTRVELAGTELREEMVRTGLVLIAALTSWFFVAMAIAFAALAVILASGDSYRIPVALLLACLFLAAGGAGAWAARRFATAKPRPFDASLTELRKDYELLKNGR